MLIPSFSLKFSNSIKPKMVTVGKYDGRRPCLTCATTADKVGSCEEAESPPPSARTHAHPHAHTAHARSRRTHDAYARTHREALPHALSFSSNPPDQIFIHNPHERRAVEGAPGEAEDAGANNVTGDSDIRFLNINRQVTSLVAGNLTPSGTGPDILLVATSTNLAAYDVEANADIFFKEVPHDAESTRARARARTYAPTRTHAHTHTTPTSKLVHPPAPLHTRPPSDDATSVSMVTSS